jgi:hypothetical protein
VGFTANCLTGARPECNKRYEPGPQAPGLATIR